MFINLISSIIVFIVSMGINFVLTPFILKSLGNEAYGFVGLSNAIVSYASIITLAINSMCGRFVAYEWHKGNTDEARIYYSSVLVTNVFFSLLIMSISAIFIFRIDDFLDVPNHLKHDIQLTFLFYFINFCVGLFNAIFSIGIFVKNKLYLISIRSAISSVILAVFIVVLFYFFAPCIAYIAISALMSSFFVLFSTIFIIKRVMPELKFSINYFKFKAIKTLLKSGIFNSFNALNRILLMGMDLFICNIFLGANATGLLAVSKAAPIVLESFVAQLSAIFAPKFVELYSKCEIIGLVKQAKFSMSVVGFIIIAPSAVFVVFGREFYTLWLSFKSYDEIVLIYELSMITLAPILLIGLVFSLFNLDNATNKLFRPAIANTILGLSTILAQIAVLKFTSYGLYGVVAVGAVFYSFRIICFDLINAALNLNLKFYTFYGVYVRNLSVFMLVCVVMFGFKAYLNLQVKSWSEFCLVAIVFGFVGYVFSLVMLFKQNEQIVVLNLIKNKFKRSRT